MASDLIARLESRWRSTCKGRLGAADSIPWLYDLAAQHRQDEVLLSIAGYSSATEALKAEDALRRRKRREGWHVSSDR